MTGAAHPALQRFVALAFQPRAGLGRQCPHKPRQSLFVLTRAQASHLHERRTCTWVSAPRNLLICHVDSSRKN